MRWLPLHSRTRVLEHLIDELRAPDTQLSTEEREVLRAQAAVLTGLLAEDQVASQTPLAGHWPIDLPADILARICRFLSHKETLLVLPATSKTARSAPSRIMMAPPRAMRAATTLRWASPR